MFTILIRTYILTTINLIFKLKKTKQSNSIIMLILYYIQWDPMGLCGNSIRQIFLWSRHPIGHYCIYFEAVDDKSGRSAINKNQTTNFYWEEIIEHSWSIRAKNFGRPFIYDEITSPWLWTYSKMKYISYYEISLLQSTEGN